MCCLTAIVVSGLILVRAGSDWSIPENVAKSFLRSKRYANPRCFNDENWCESNTMSCLGDNENVRENRCTPTSCPSGQTCYLSTPCPAHYRTGCSATNPCLSLPCYNGGTCNKRTATSYACRCLPGYDSGTDCRTNINECASNPCVHGICTDQMNSYRCTCNPGFTGTNCARDINECASSPCLHGTCNDQINSYSCQCDPGYIGKNCEQDIDECASNPCVYGNCTDQINNYTCQCEPGYTGYNCSQDIDECASNPCIYGNCTDQINNYTCQCDPGYRGYNCSQDIDECNSSPCVYGQCMDQVNQFSCQCFRGYEGVLCEHEEFLFAVPIAVSLGVVLLLLLALFIFLIFLCKNRKNEKEDGMMKNIMSLYNEPPADQKKIKFQAKQYKF